MRISMEMSGVQESIANLNRINVATTLRYEDALKESGKAIRKNMKRRIAVLTGETKKSIRMKASRDKKTIRVGPQGKGAWKAHFIEFGTVKMPAQPFAIPAWEQEKPDYIARIRDAVRGAIDS